jgi:hypothetical protein
MLKLTVRYVRCDLSALSIVLVPVAYVALPPWLVAMLLAGGALVVLQAVGHR